MKRLLGARGEDALVRAADALEALAAPGVLAELCRMRDETPTRAGLASPRQQSIEAAIERLESRLINSGPARR